MSWYNPSSWRKGAKVVETKLTENVVKEKELRQQYLDMLKMYEDDYAISRRTIGFSVADAKRTEFLSSLFAKLPGFAHKDLVKYVFNTSPNHFAETSKNIEQMETAIRQPTPHNLKMFDAAQKVISHPIATNLSISENVFMSLVQNDEFDRVLCALNNTDFPFKTIVAYCKVSKLENDYFKELIEHRKVAVPNTEKRAT